MKPDVELIELSIVLLIGGVAGWLSNEVYKGSGLGLFGDIILGVLGGWLGYWLFGMSPGDDVVSFIFKSAIGAIVIVFLVKVIFKKRPTQKT
jgi:uncharacterized membrane protein YeaQ/YmgE (transglycosylase-associated protein family)